MRRTALLPVLALCVLATAGAGPGEAGPAETAGEGLIQQAAGSLFVFEAREAPISAALEELEARHGIAIGGSHHVAERAISGRFEGNMPEILERIFQKESFVLFFGDAKDASTTGISRLVFTGRSDGAAASAPAEPVRDRAPMPEHLYHEGLPPPPIPDVVAHAIAPPPPFTPEREAFDKALTRTEAELEAALRPLRALANQSDF